MNKYKFPINLFISLALLSFMPFIYEIIRSNLIANIPSTDGFSISGHIEWFDLINETIQAFLIVPLYCLFNKVIDNKEAFKQRINQTFFISFIIYTLFSIIILLTCKNIVKSMTSNNIAEVTAYLRLETLSFIAANFVSFTSVLFVVLDKPKYIYFTIILKTLFTIIGDLVLIPNLGVNGIAYSNISVNIAIDILCILVLRKEDLFIKPNFKFSKDFIIDYIKIGLFSGSEILLNNIIYIVVVCKMVNKINEQGNYWIANNIVWGLLLIPITALTEIIKKDCKYKLNKNHFKIYFKVASISFILWLLFIPVLNPFLKNIMGISNYRDISKIITLLIPFYFAYGISAIFDSILIGKGKSNYLFGISLIINLIYYPIIYITVKKEIFTPSITFICIMFGLGILIHAVMSIIFYNIYKIREKNFISIKN